MSMATFEMDGVDAYIEMVNKLGSSYDTIVQRVVKKGCAVAAKLIAAANNKFAKYVKQTSPKKNEYGWYAQVKFDGKTSSGESAAKVASVYEYGRKAGSYTDGKGHRRPYPAQAPRPWIQAAIARATPEVVQTMQEEYDEAVSSIVGD